MLMSYAIDFTSGGRKKKRCLMSERALASTLGRVVMLGAALSVGRTFFLFDERSTAGTTAKSMMRTAATSPMTMSFFVNGLGPADDPVIAGVLYSCCSLGFGMVAGCSAGLLPLELEAVGVAGVCSGFAGCDGV